MNQKLGKRKCKNCKEVFEKSQPLQYVCSPKCAIEYSKKIQVKEWKQNKQKELIKLETKSQVEARLQTEINTIVRLIDKCHNCISSGNPLGTRYDAGHLYSRGSNPAIRFHLFNIWSQSVEQNRHKGGNQLGMAQGIEKEFSKEIREYCESLQKISYQGFSKDDLKEYTKEAKKIVSELKAIDEKFDTIERLNLRVKYNKRLGIYNE